jgi:hypothetical protein
MGRIIRYEFVGNWLVLVLLFMSVIFIPFGVIYFILTAVKIEEEIENPNEFIAAFKEGKYRGKGAS